MKNMKKEKVCTILYFTASFCCFLSAIIGFIYQNDISIGAMWLGLGCVNLCLGCLWFGQYKKNSEKKE